MKRLILLLPLCLMACGGGTIENKRPDVSRAAPSQTSGMTYPEFRHHPMNRESDYLAAQKRFMALDRNNDGRLSSHELGE
jgi:hypothetical protein